MGFVGKMQVPIYKVIGVVAVGNGLMATVWPMSMRLVMSGTCMTGSALLWIFISDGKHMFINMSFMHMMKVSVVQKVGMAFVLDFRMAAGVMVNVVMRFMHGMVGHDQPPLLGDGLFPWLLGQSFGEFMKQGFRIFPTNAGIGNGDSVVEGFSLAP